MSDTEIGLMMSATYACGVFLVGFAIALAIAFSPLPTMLEQPEMPKQNPAWIGFDRIDR
jgi:hypothetical protein